MDLKALQTEVARLKSIAPSASVAMADVGFHLSNLWFAQSIADLDPAATWPR